MRELHYHIWTAGLFTLNSELSSAFILDNIIQSCLNYVKRLYLWSDVIEQDKKYVVFL